MKKLIIILLTLPSLCEAQQNNSGTNASMNSTQIRELLQMDSATYVSFAENLKLFRDSISGVISDTTINKEFRMYKVGQINQQQSNFLHTSLTPVQLAAYNHYLQTRAALSPRRKTE